ncbi:hypothetical protein [Seonamhaeicola maritimus]|uniref:hypothetical protein n=1 Tax=Seonamhaeicola maritimus TaxID=2591822 RepID=UPI0024947DC0|nr:hypothetical protein [Seonamhaeicola maritimus]
MDKLKVIKNAIIIGISLFIISANSQEKSGSFKFKALDFGLGIYNDCQATLENGFNGDMEFQFDINSNILSFQYKCGIGLIDNGTLFNNVFDVFLEVNLLYGRELLISKKVLCGFHLGAGYIHSTKLFGDVKNAMGFPVSIKLVHVISKQISLGVSPYVNFNRLNNLYSLNLFLRVKFNK